MNLPKIGQRVISIAIIERFPHWKSEGIGLVGEVLESSDLCIAVEILNMVKLLL